MTKELIYRYFEGSCSEQEAQEVKAYLNGNDLRLFHEYMDEVDRNNEEEYPISKQESDQLLHDIYGKINTEEVIKSVEPLEKRVPVFSLRIAAGIALICSLAGTGYFLLKDQLKPKNQEEWTTISNSSSNVKKIEMTDGSSIWLNAHSSFSFNKALYNVKNREIRMQGEAYFEVSQQANQPFIVHTGKLNTTVLGTSFNVEAYSNEKSIRVILLNGKVKVGNGEHYKIMKPGQLLKYSITADQFALQDVEASEANAWINGKLVFNGISLKDALYRIAQLYHMEILPDAGLNLDNKTLSGVFDRKAPEDILKKVLFVHGLKYHRKGGAYLITP